MKSRKHIYCLLDSETFGGVANPKGMYNVSGYIFDRYRTIYATFNFLIMENYGEIEKDSYAKKNFYKYDEMIKNGEITTICTEDEAVELIDNLCKTFNVNYMTAYNTGFDYVKTKCRKLIENREFIDGYLMALQTITHKKSYADFCRKNGFKSASGKSCATSAESVYAYLTDNPNYKEEHTALEDCKIEMEIFLACLKMHKKFTKNYHQFDYKKRGSKCFPKWDIA